MNAALCYNVNSLFTVVSQRRDVYQGVVGEEGLPHRIQASARERQELIPYSEIGFANRSDLIERTTCYLQLNMGRLRVALRHGHNKDASEC